MNFVGGVFLYKIFKDYIVRNSLLQKNHKVLVAVSGGADSMCLLTMLQMLANEWPMQLAVCHVNHNLRDQEAAKDAMFVSDYCRQHTLEYEIVHVQVRPFAKQNNMSIEQAARILRYQALSDIKIKLCCDLIATAHNKNDQAETFLLNMLRGAGINGLKGMVPQQGCIVRPLLDINREDIESFCLTHQVEYCHDSSNDSTEYLRNRVRHELIPTLQAYNPNIINSLTKNMQAIRMDAEYLNEQAQAVATDIISSEFVADCITVHLNLHLFRKLAPSIAIRVLLLAIEKKSGSVQGITQTHLLQVYRLAHSNTGSKKLVLPNDTLVYKFYDKMSIGADRISDSEKQANRLIISTVGDYVFHCCTISVTKEICSNTPVSNCRKVYLPYELLTEHELCIRSKLPGDYFELKGGGHKSLKSFFIDKKIPLDNRSKVPLLYLGDRLLCIMGYRYIDYTLPSANKEYLVLEIANTNY